MKLCLIVNANAESGLHEATGLFDEEFEGHFADKTFGQGLLGFSTALTCRDPGLHLKARRTIFSKQRAMLEFDVMFHMAEMQRLPYYDRPIMVMERLYAELESILVKRRLPDFNHKDFLREARGIISQISISIKKQAALLGEETPKGEQQRGHTTLFCPVKGIAPLGSGANADRCDPHVRQRHSTLYKATHPRMSVSHEKPFH